MEFGHENFIPLIRKETLKMSIPVGIIIIIAGILFIALGSLRSRASISRGGITGPVGLAVLAVGAIVYLIETGYLDSLFWWKAINRW